MNTKLLLVALATASVCHPADAEVTHSDTNSFTSEFSVEVGQSPDKVYDIIVQDIGKWWSSGHTWSGDAKNLSIDPVAGGCFCEAMSDGSVLHLTVSFAKHGSLLRMRGALGPLQTLPVQGVQTWKMSEGEDGATKLSLTYQVSGSIPGGLESWAAAVDGVLGEQFHRLVRFAETGSPAEDP